MKHHPGSRYSDRYRPYKAGHDDDDVDLGPVLMGVLNALDVAAVGATVIIVTYMVVMR